MNYQIVVFAFLAILGCSLAASSDLCTVTPTSSEPLQILLPLYQYPGAAWDTVIASANPGVKIIAIINPSSGPLAPGPDAAFTKYMAKMTNAGIEMVGYVHTSYGTRSLSSVNAEIDLYASKYPGLTGVFLDEASAAARDVPFYTDVYNRIKSKGYVHSILNPGAQSDQGYLAISSNIVIFEDYGSNLNARSYPDFVKCAPSEAAKSGYKYKFSGIAHTTSASSLSSVLSGMKDKGMGLVYVTDGAGGCCTYNTVASYFGAQVSAVAALNQ